MARRLPRRPPPVRAIPAGTWAAAGWSHAKLTRPHSVPLMQYVTPVTAPITTDGIAGPTTVPASGAISVKVGPQGVGTTWALDQCYVSTSVGLLDTAQCIVYVGPVAVAGYEVTGTISAGGSQFGLGGLGMTVGDFVIASFTGATVGSTVKLRVTGQRRC